MAEFTLDEMRAHRDALETRIAAACAKCNRPRGSVMLIWVSKFHPLASVENALALRAKQFGENRVQEAVEQFTEKRPGVRCHVIGPVQSNKLKKAALALLQFKKRWRQKRELLRFIQH